MTTAPLISEEDVLAEYGRDALVLAARHECWRRGDLSFYCSDVQLTARAMVYEHPSRRIVWETNRRFGKSRTGVVISGEHCLAFPGIRIPYAAPTATQVRAFVHPPMLALSSIAPDDLAPEVVSGEWVFPPMQWFNAEGNPVPTRMHGGVELARFKGKKVDEMLCMSRVAPHGCEDRKKADALRGTGTVFALIDEARDIPILSYVVGSVVGPMLWEARSRWHEDVSATMLVASTTPEETEHPFIEMADAAEAKDAYFHATVYDCDHLDERAVEEAIEEAGGEDTVQWQVEGLAKRTRDPKLMAIAEFTDACIYEVERPEYFAPCVIGDHGNSDMTVIAFGYYDFKADRFVIEDEVSTSRARSDEISEMVANKERELWPRHTVKRRRLDAAPQVRQDMSREEWQGEGDDPLSWQNVSRDSDKRHGRMRALANRARVLCKAGQVVVHPRCKVIAAHTKGAKWNKLRTSFVRPLDEKKEPIHHYDGCAALLYFLRDCDKTTNPYPALPPGVSRDTHYIPADLERAREKKKIAAIFGRGRRR